jgi:hypothetical protein
VEDTEIDVVLPLVIPLHMKTTALTDNWDKEEGSQLEPSVKKLENY